jgi:hypothetical protein
MPTMEPTPTSRRIVCGRCGAAFDCTLDGPCWCAAEPYRLPLPTDTTDCLCPACLRALAAARPQGFGSSANSSGP